MGTRMIDRRRFITTVLAATASPSAARLAGAAEMSRVTAYGFSFAGLNGGEIRLADFANRPILVVNTASLCGYTPQYAGLQMLWTEFSPRGLMVIGVPSNDFAQEPGGVTEIGDTALVHYGVSFPMAAKVGVKGAGAHPFYKWAAAERPRDVPRWNFHKYLIGRDGHLAEVFPESIEPTDTRIRTAIARSLAES
jgi:glutathione peroxidase